MLSWNQQEDINIHIKITPCTHKHNLYPEILNHRLSHNYNVYQFMNIETYKNHYMNSCINNQTTINTQVKCDNKNNDSKEIIHRIHIAVYQRLKQ